MDDPRTSEAQALMQRFAERTGLVGEKAPRRYLWTDAFAVCNLCGLGEYGADPRQITLAESLADQVHHVLGKHRDDDVRTGWISGLEDREGERHPTRGGLRIGKTKPERLAGASIDERAEWDCDGQYFHYLTRWAHALGRLGLATGNRDYGRWSRELLAVAIDRFSVGPGGLAWKMSIDLTRPQVPTTGHHDALDGLVTALVARSRAFDDGVAGDVLGPELHRLAGLLRPRELVTADALGLGGLLDAGSWLVQLGEDARPFEGLAAELFKAAEVGLRRYTMSPDSVRPASQRLAFRELGLAIGLQSVERLPEARSLDPWQHLSRQVIAYWLDPAHQRVESWTDHLDINEVMLATALAPEGYVWLRGPRRDPEPVAAEG